ncbi:peptidase [Dysgonomonas sp. 25]|nr:peptidase [Dysgonomonas sp. 25]
MVGVCLVYGISGFLLNHMNGKDPAFTTTEESIQLDKSLTNEELKVIWADKKLPELKRIMAIDDVHSRLMLNGGIGVYNSATGIVDYETHSKNEFIFWINKLHYNKVKGWSVMADIFAVSLIFFAVSGIFIVKGKHGVARRGKWYLIVGIIIPVVYVILA